jgi:hypothetical protein
MSNRYVKFEKTNLYKEFGEGLSVEPDILTWSDHDFYEGTLSFLRDTFGCSTTPTQSQMDLYITNNECIEDIDRREFKLLIDKLFVTYKSIYKITKKINNNHIIKERVSKEREEKSLKVKMLKEDEKRRNQEFNRAIIPCECGAQVVRCFKKQHVGSAEHRFRLDGIRWILSAQPELASLVTDDTSISSIESEIV